MKLLTVVSFFLVCCSPSPKEVVKKRFPECFNHPVGATSWAACKKADKEWHITFWHGFGDCESGCINSEQTAWYLVNEKDGVWNADKHFNPRVKMGPNQPIDKGTPSFKKGPQQSVFKTPGDPKKPKEPDKGDKKHEEKTVWLGKSVVVPQCLRENELRQITSEPVFGATVLESRFSPPRKLGPDFEKKTSKWEKEVYEADRDEFMCEACHVCSTFAHKYIKVYAKDVDKFVKGFGGWMRIDK